MAEVMRNKQVKEDVECCIEEEEWEYRVGAYVYNAAETLDQAIERVEQQAYDMGYEINEWYIDICENELTDSRKEHKRMRADQKSGKIEFLLIWDHTALMQPPYDKNNVWAD